MAAQYVQCNQCKQWGFLPHTCAPQWEATLEENIDYEVSITYGKDAKEAALKFAKDNFAKWEYPEEMEIWVRKSQNDSWIKFNITVEAEPVFLATEITDSDLKA